MKKIVVTMMLTVACVGAFAQGKIGFVNDSLHLAYLTSVKPADAALLNQPTPNGALPSGITLVAGLYAGTDSTSLSLYSTTTLTSLVGPGKWGSVSTLLTSPFIGGGTTAFFQVKIWDNAFGTTSTGYDNSRNGQSYYGLTPIFTAVAGSSVTYPPLYSHSTSPFSTWPDGTFDLGGGNLGSIPIGIVPEPSTFALAGMGLASLLIFRRKK